MTDMLQDLPLSGIRVLDLTRVRAGPTCVRQFADWGADVIKVEVPDSAGGDGGLGGPRDGPDFQNLHRNKRSIAINMKTGAGHALLLKLAETADVVVENFRPDVKHRLKIAYEDLSAVNEGLIYVSISGFGQDGPYEKRPGVDQIAQGMGGLMSITGEPGGGPMRVGIPVADLTAGLLAAQGAMMALIQRHRTGKGQWISTSLLQSQIFMLDFQAARWLVDEEVAGQVGNEHPTGVPTNAYPTADGYMNAAPAGQKLFERFCHAIGAPELIEHPDFGKASDRYRNRDALNDRIAGILKTRTTDEWIGILNEAGVPCGPINSIDQTFADPQVQHLGMAQPVEDGGEPLTLVRQAIQMSAAEPKLWRRAGAKGAESDDILSEAGYDSAEIEALRRNGVI